MHNVVIALLSAIVASFRTRFALQIAIVIGSGQIETHRTLAEVYDTLSVQLLL